MLDGFQFDTEYGAGPYEKARLPEAKGLSSLPSGMIPVGNPHSSEIPDGIEADLDLDLGEITKDASEQLVPLVDHSWLAQEPEPDLSGLRSHEDILQQFADGRFEHPQANQIKALQEAWGDGSTTGLDIIPNDNRKHAPYANPYHKHQSKLPGDDYRQVVEQALRKTAYGSEPLDSILSSLSALPKKARALARNEVISEYGLNGRVYIKEAHFPGLFNGRWDEVLNQRCASALYIIANQEDCVHDRFLGKKVLASEGDISWGHATKQLLPKLSSCGVRVASHGAKKDILRRAFLDLMSGDVETPAGATTWWQLQSDPSQGLSLSEAQERLENAIPEVVHIDSVEHLAEVKANKKLERVATQLVQQGFLDKEVAESVLATAKTASQKLDRLYVIASQPVEASSYEGTGTEVRVHTPTKSKLATEFKTRSELTYEQRVKVAQTKLAGLISTGMVSAEEVESIARENKSEPEIAVKRAYELAANNFMVEGQSSYGGAGVGATSRTLRASFFNEKDKKSFEGASPNAKAEARRTERALEKIGLMVTANLISYEEVAMAIQGVKDPALRVASVCAFIARPKSATTYQDYALTEHRMVKPSKKLDKLPNMKKRASASLWREAHAKVDKLVKSGLLTAQDFSRIQSEPDANEYVRKAFDIASKPQQVTTYEGTETAHIRTKKSNEGVSVTEAKLAKWVRQKMAEGSAGNELDTLLSSRFSTTTLDTYKDRVASLRNEHEGLSGHAYVDVGAYETEGVEGCDKGALIHRTNTLPAALQVKKCATCVFNVEGTCQKYNKPLISSPTEIVENAPRYQREMIRLANGSDADKTASLFTNPSTEYDPDEFGLANDGDVDIDSEVPNEVLGDVLFGGFEV
jgi:hypothetical protein